ncbi:hypothetical protein Fmac_001360 [Flemingia macrophylla]|uniref:Uncharacterized protein n=1 Tax=Flemingia macrophylla TaxID=520843 RepID=A0ABD1NJP4_9FABA
MELTFEAELLILTLGFHSLAFECINSIRSFVREFPNIFVKRWSQWIFLQS